MTTRRFCDICGRECAEFHVVATGAIMGDLDVCKVRSQGDLGCESFFIAGVDQAKVLAAAALAKRKKG